MLALAVFAKAGVHCCHHIDIEFAFTDMEKQCVRQTRSYHMQRRICHRPRLQQLRILDNMTWIDIVLLELRGTIHLELLSLCNLASPEGHSIVQDTKALPLL